MKKLIVFTREDGGVSVVNPVDGIPLERIIERAVPKGFAYSIVDESEVSTDRTFRNAWKFDGRKIEVDMPKARELVKEKLRQQRAPLLAALDIEFMQALEGSDAAKAKDIKDRKQKLRDVTAHPDIEKAKTPEDLKALNIAAMTL